MGRPVLGLLLVVAVGCDRPSPDTTRTEPNKLRAEGPSPSGIVSSLPTSDAARLVPPAAGPRPPPMGWSSWSHFHRNVHEAGVRAQADELAAKLAPMGFVYVNVDGGWFECCERRSDRRRPERERGHAARVRGRAASMALRQPRRKLHRRALQSRRTTRKGGPTVVGPGPVAPGVGS
jgi:hypothetical protein